MEKVEDLEEGNIFAYTERPTPSQIKDVLRAIDRGRYDATETVVKFSVDGVNLYFVVNGVPPESSRYEIIENFSGGKFVASRGTLASPRRGEAVVREMIYRPLEGMSHKYKDSMRPWDGLVLIEGPEGRIEISVKFDTFYYGSTSPPIWISYRQ